VDRDETSKRVTDTTIMRPADEVEAWLDGITSEPAPEETPARGPQPSLYATILRRGLLLFAASVVVFLVFAFWLSGLAHARSQIGLQRRFRTELANIEAPIGGTIPAGAPVAVLRIPTQGVDEVVVEGARSRQLEAGPGHVIGSSLPGQPGNAVLAGRRTLYGGPFRHIGSLATGDRILVTTGEGKSIYRITGVARKVAATDGSIFGDYGDNRLTLVTSDPVLRASRRLVVTATLVGKPYASTPLVRNLDAEGLGLSGERGAIAVVLVWLELLVGLALLTVYAMTRWSRWAAWVAFAPALALVVWIFFENAVRLLPATL
jgi:sortase A